MVFDKKSNIANKQIKQKRAFETAFKDSFYSILFYC